MSTKVINERYIHYIEMSYGNCYRMRSALSFMGSSSYGRTHENNKTFDMPIKINDEVIINILPDIDYIMGLVTLKEESTLDDISYEIVELQQSYNGMDDDHRINGKPTIIKFKMPNDNVILRVNFIRLVGC